MKTDARARARVRVQEHCLLNLLVPCDACGTRQPIAVGYEQERHRMTGGAWFRINRCVGCGEKISGSAIDMEIFRR